VSLREALRVAMQAVFSNRLRSALTTLGVIIGVLAVVLLVAIGQGAREEITDTIEGLGSNLLFVVPGDGDFSQAPARSKFTVDEVDAIARAVGGDERVAGYVVSGETVRGESGSSFASVLGVTDDYLAVAQREIARGQAFSPSDVVTGRRVAVLGAGIADALFAGSDPIGKNVTVGSLRFRVTGVLDAVGASAFGPDRDLQVMLPLGAAQRLFGTDRIDVIFVTATSTAAITADQDTVESVLAERLDDADYSVLTQDEIIGVVGDILQILTLVLAAIAGISLLVGGVGVSNIMLVSVSERTREIGLRKALGARPKDITRQFLIEAVVLTGTGGLIGLGAGVGLAHLVGRVSPLPASVTGWSIALALGVSIAVGVFFGVWPARRAGRMDPVEALRHE
jgi:putative ABC transport system permease protein